MQTQSKFIHKWLHPFAVLTAIVAVLLIVAGAMVTSTHSGDAVPDWPLSYGSLTPPMIGGILFEHSHRLVAGLTAILITILAMWLWIAKPGRTVQWLGIAALAGVFLQASLGGLRVLLVSTASVRNVALSLSGASSVETVRIGIAVAHAFLAQTILCILFSIAFLIAPSNRRSANAFLSVQRDRKAFRLGIFLSGLIFLQLIIGALVRHSGAGLSIPDFPLSFGRLIPPFGNLPQNASPFPVSTGVLQFRVGIHFAHRVMALLILVMVLYFFGKYRKTAKIGKFARSLLYLTVIQIALGALNIWTGKLVYVTVLHVAVGALLLSCSVAIVLAARYVPQSEKPNGKLPRKARAYLELTKPRLTTLVMFSALTGYCLGNSGTFDFSLMFSTLVGIGLASAGALALNQYAERGYDTMMLRTQKRPLPQGRLTPREALVFGSVLCVFSVMYLLVTVNILTAVLVFLTIIIYLLAYTPLKRISYFNTAVGAVSGALPIVCGWTGARNILTVESLLLFGILFFWQFPHFFSIVLLYSEDYRRAGFKMLPLQDGGISKTNRQIIFTCALLLGISLIPALMGIIGRVYLLAALLAGGAFLGFGISVALHQGRVFARRLLLASFGYPLIVWSFMIIDKVRV